MSDAISSAFGPIFTDDFVTTKYGPAVWSMAAGDCVVSDDDDLELMGIWLMNWGLVNSLSDP